MLYLKAYAATALVFFALDAIWLGLVARGFYASQLGPLMRDEIGYAAAGIFYLAYVGGAVFFAVAPALAEASWTRAVLNGALLGLIAYGTYDITNLATLRDWPLAMSLVDMGWGATVTALSALAGYGLTRLLS